ncbi:hypothetical protein LY90DRAFT_513719 [Neocallimastix californiae]|uniref:Ubiquitin-like domain-containing protein n=1 Tax=Neocallimastix californiae TaxID=1754190 RepID=A0A1Y2AVP0_9FUNG|nr:hypothetical protein LY90DRAFT_513719 [Neocallimastix californiae]|eukprot:ORY26651.1 hypothetical protein LY90DRAFT_513719 [Neocallimastix californiae]
MISIMRNNKLNYFITIFWKYKPYELKFGDENEINNAVVGRVKNIFANKFKIPEDSLKLTYKKVVLEDDKKLINYGIKNAATIDMEYVKPKQLKNGESNKKQASISNLENYSKNDSISQQHQLNKKYNQTQLEGYSNNNNFTTSFSNHKNDSNILRNQCFQNDKANKHEYKENHDNNNYKNERQPKTINIKNHKLNNIPISKTLNEYNTNIPQHNDNSSINNSISQNSISNGTELSREEILKIQRIEDQRIGNQRIENQRIENQRIENQRIENQRIESQRIENQRIENQRIENQRRENQMKELEMKEKQKIENQRIKNQRIKNQRIENQRIENQRIENQRIEEKEKILIGLDNLNNKIFRKIIPKIKWYKEKVENYSNDTDQVELNKYYKIITQFLVQWLNVIESNIETDDINIKEEYVFTITLIKKLLNKLDDIKKNYLKKQKIIFLHNLIIYHYI